MSKKARLPALVKNVGPYTVAAQWAADIERVLLSLPDGSHSADIALLLGRHVQGVKKALRVAHRAGRCIQKRMGLVGVLWLHIDYADRMVEIRKAHDDLLFAKRNLIRNAARRTATLVRAEAACSDFERA